jgi:hypothetical protein
LSPINMTLAGSGSQTIDLTSLTNTVYETFSLGHALTILVLPTGNSVTLTPGGTNGLAWFFGGTSPSITIPAGGCLLFSEPVAGPGHVVDGTHKTLTFTNASGAAATVQVLVVGSTT